MKDAPHLSAEKVYKKINEISNTLIDTQHQLIQKDIELASFAVELGLQKKQYALLRKSYLNLIHTLKKKSK